ncbi:MAG: hypothetical protein Q7T81_01600 [Pseudolabrys sp.]|nr:hypothetical protein [Pseudolabrys sp.]
MLDPLNADELRLWAQHCAAKAEHTVSPQAERQRLLTIRDSLLALAESADWLHGRSTDLAVQRAAE